MMIMMIYTLHANFTFTYLNSRMVGSSSKKDTHGLGRHMRLPRDQTGGIGTVKSSPSVKKHHLLSLSLGMHIRDNFQR